MVKDLTEQHHAFHDWAASAQLASAAAQLSQNFPGTVCFYWTNSIPSAPSPRTWQNDAACRLSRFSSIQIGLTGPVNGYSGVYDHRARLTNASNTLARRILMQNKCLGIICASLCSRGASSSKGLTTQEQEDAIPSPLSESKSSAALSPRDEVGSGRVSLQELR